MEPKQIEIRFSPDDADILHQLQGNSRIAIFEPDEAIRFENPDQGDLHF